MSAITLRMKIIISRCSPLIFIAHSFAYYHAKNGGGDGGDYFDD